MPVDYDKLAQQHGGTVVEPDYDALASASGAQPAAGFERALAGSDTVGAAPWYTQHVDSNAPARWLAEKLKPGSGANVPQGLPLPSVTKALSFLPGAGGTLGGMVGGAGGSVPGAIGGAALGAGGGEAARQLAMRALTGGGKANPGESALDIGTEAGTAAALQGLGEAASPLVNRALKGTASRFMQSAVKPNVSLLKEYKTTAPKLVQTLLDEGVNVSPGGLEKLTGLLDSTNAEIKQLVRNAPGTISRDAVVARALPVKGRLAQQVNPGKPLREASRVIEEFRTAGAVPTRGPTGAQSFAMAPPTAAPLTPTQAQAMKIGTYQQIGKSYGQLSNASMESQKALARGLKEELEVVVPEIKALNAKDAKYMAAMDAIGHRLAIAGNRDPVGFAWAASQNPKTFLAALIDRSPAVKSLIARGLYGSAGKVSSVSPQLIRLAVHALASEEPVSEPAQE